MAFTEEKFKRQLAIAEVKLEEIIEISKSEDTGDIASAYEQIGELIKRLEKSKDDTAEHLLESETELEKVKQWTVQQKGSILVFREARTRIRKQLDEATEKETQLKLEKELLIQRRRGGGAVKIQITTTTRNGGGSCTTATTRGRVVQKET